LRNAIGREAARLSLRRAAREIALSPNGLRNFLNGSTPHSASRVKLERWLATQSRTTPPPNVGQLVRLVNELAVDLSRRQAVELGREVARWLAEAYEARQLGAPHWVQELLRHYRPRRGKSQSEVA
jgi:transcriptional regulator with XRE-family HTH domain